MKTSIIITVVAVLFISLLAVFLLNSDGLSKNSSSGISEINNNQINQDYVEPENSGEFEQAFSNIGLRTNTEISSIPLEEVLGGGPAKDGIPSIDNPKFISVSKANEIEDDDRNGVVVQIGKTVRFYSYSILVWHEIVNDIIEGKNVLVTFCPLCGSAIVFDPTIGTEARQFGVSGKLWQSNLLMYDRVTESLWSQSIGEAVVGKETGKKLEIISSQVMPFGEFKEKYPNGEVLSRETNYNRNYNLYPYGDYDDVEETIFPVSIQDNRLPAKEIMYVVNIGDESVAFKRSDLLENKSAEINTKSGLIKAKTDGSEIVVTDSSLNIIPGYHEMWFSWATHHQENGIVWTK